MIFVLFTDVYILHVFAQMAHAMSFASGIDVEDEYWIFFGDSGNHLKPAMLTPNCRGNMAKANGTYCLKEDPASRADELSRFLPFVSKVYGHPPLSSIEDISNYLKRAPAASQAAPATRLADPEPAPVE